MQEIGLKVMRFCAAESHPVFSLNASAADKSQQDRYHGDYEKDMDNTSNTENKSTEKPTYDKDDCYDV